MSQPTEIEECSDCGARGLPERVRKDGHECADFQNPTDSV